ncbi:MAG: 2-keto-4-pentenoate hydratase [Acidobacteriaceae bacterium]|jgi:2-keto-4-pentenoate hydratase
MISGAREKELIEAADLLLDARRTHKLLAELPPALVPTTLEEVARVHDEMALAYEEIGGWKIGAGSLEATPFFAPMPRAWMAASGAILSGPTYRYRVLEAEISFLVGEDLPPRAKPYTRDEVIAAMASCHPAIEELESGLIDPKAENNYFSALADLQINGGFIHGPACVDWKSINFATETVTLSIDGAVQVERTGSNTSGDLLRLLPYLANEGAARTGGLKAGQWITTGSWTGNTPAGAGKQVDVKFAHAGHVSLRFA